MGVDGAIEAKPGALLRDDDSRRGPWAALRSWSGLAKRFGFRQLLKLVAFGVFVDELFGDFGGSQRDFPRREGMKEDANGEGMPRGMYLRNTHTLYFTHREKCLCDVVTRF